MRLKNFFINVLSSAIVHEISAFSYYHMGKILGGTGGGAGGCSAPPELLTFFLCTGFSPPPGKGGRPGKFSYYTHGQNTKLNLKTLVQSVATERFSLNIIDRFQLILQTVLDHTSAVKTSLVTNIDSLNKSAI